ncbi:hypothetical protein [Pseudomonas sp. NPDC008258]|uniref:hypothetical protein n=1 Tax=Pseudomonas sp. NPDC008258 TaxID=3364418 RepID=UPI0036E698B0
MQEANCLTSSVYEVTVDMMNLYSHFFSIVQYLNSSDDRAWTTRERQFKSSVLCNFSELEDEYQDSLLICFGEHPKVRAMRSLTRPKLKHTITLLNAWNHAFEAFGSVDVFLAGMGIRIGYDQSFNKQDFRQAKNRILCAVRILRQDCLSFIETSHLVESTLLEYARAVVFGIDSDQLFD